MGFASLLSIAAYVGLLGERHPTLRLVRRPGQRLRTAPLIAWLTGGRYYLARPPAPVAPQGYFLRARLTEKNVRFANANTKARTWRTVPPTKGPICSLCCITNDSPNSLETYNLRVNLWVIAQFKIKKPIKSLAWAQCAGGEGGIRTARYLAVRLISNQVHSTTLPPLRSGRHNSTKMGMHWFKTLLISDGFLCSSRPAASKACRCR